MTHANTNLTDDRRRWKNITILFRSLLIFILLMISTAPAAGQSTPDLTDPPPAPLEPAPEALSEPSTQAAAACTRATCIYLPGLFFQTATLDRASSLSLYQTLFLSGNNVSHGWNGSVSTCTAGSTSSAFKTAVLNRINYFRRAAGVPPISGFNNTYNSKAQAAALIMSKQNALSHSPDTSWGCYTSSGAEAAGKSNLGLGMFGPGSIHSYMRDHGSNNTAAGHRRWILYPQTREMGTGDIPSGSGFSAAQSLWVFDSHSNDPRPTTRTPYVAWPPAGYIPYPVVYARWSFSYDNANFASASVSLSQNGSSVPVTKYSVQNGYGENTLVWIINGMSDSAAWSRPAKDTPYTVNISNVIIDGKAQNFSYTVVIFDPG